MRLFLTLFFSFLVTFTHFVNALENVGVKTLEQAFATSSLVSDSDALTFGIADFELKYATGEDWGNEETLNFKKSIDILVLPYQWQLNDLEKNWSHAIDIRMFYIEVHRNSEPLQGFTNFEKERVLGGFLQYSQHYQWSENWYSGLSLGGHIMHYRNKYNYSDDFPVELIDILDGHIFNTSATVLMAEPVLKLGYQQVQSWGEWTLHNSNHYLIGQGVGGSAKNIHDVQPEGWRMTNGIEFKVSVPNLLGVSDHISFDFKRIDVGSDMSPVTGNGHYYETSVGWIIDTQNTIPFLDNIGIGFNINYGTTISGGTIVFYYNK